MEREKAIKDTALKGLNKGRDRRTMSNQPQSGFVRVFGESMAPELNPGDMVAVEQINNPNTLLWGETYLIVTTPEANDFKMFRKVLPGPDNDSLTLKAGNAANPDMVLPKKHIQAMFAVKGSVTQKHL